MPRQQTTVRLPGDLLAASKTWAASANVSLTRLIEEALRERVGGWSPTSVEYRLKEFDQRVGTLERIAKREGAI